jgi:GTPase SAR1 family protein
VHAIFIVGTAGSGKSLLTSRLTSGYEEKGAHCISVNLDPGAVSLPYEPDVDVRNFLNIEEIMNRYQLGPNGALILASDLLATRLNDLQEEMDQSTPDYVVIDTPGQIELFAFRESGPYIIRNLRVDDFAVVFLFDSSLVSSPVNFISVDLLSASVQLRLGAPQIPVLSKTDLFKKEVPKIVKWSSNARALEDAISEQAQPSQYVLSQSLLRDLMRLDLGFRVLPVSSVTQDGMINLAAALARIFRGGEEVED